VQNKNEKVEHSISKIKGSHIIRNKNMFLIRWVGGWVGGHKSGFGHRFEQTKMCFQLLNPFICRDFIFWDPIIHLSIVSFEMVYSKRGLQTREMMPDIAHDIYLAKLTYKNHNFFVKETFL
jgi:hypothetical protein